MSSVIIQFVFFTEIDFTLCVIIMMNDCFIIRYMYIVELIYSGGIALIIVISSSKFIDSIQVAFPNNG